MELSIQKRRRILLHFFLGVGLPSLLLGYLAFRGIQNDRALLEKERLNRHRAIAQGITASVDAHISAVEQALLDSIGNPRGLRDSALLRSLNRLKNDRPSVEEVFVFEDAGRIRFPLAAHLFFPDESTDLPFARARQTSLPKEMQAGRQYEFQQRNYRDALVAYRQAFARASGREAKAELLNAIARVQKKSMRFQDALRSYRTIVQDYDRVRMASGMPLGPVARLEIGSLFLALRDSSIAAQSLTGLYRDLIQRKWTLKKSQYEFFVQQIETSVGDIFSQGELPAHLQPDQNAFQMLKDEDRRQRGTTERLLAFQAKAAPGLLEIMARSMEDQTPGRFPLVIGGHDFLVSLPGSQDRNGKVAWGLLLDSGKLKAHVIHPAVERHASSEKISWIVRGRNGEALLKSDLSPPGAITVKADFAGDFPPWSLELYHRDPRLFETLLTSRRGIYFYMFVLLAGILIFGLTLTIRAVTHEIELGKMKSDFVSTISHEFKSPLTSIRQLAEMLQSGRVPSEARRRRYYDVLVEQSERLSLLVDNILDFARMEEGRKEFEFETVEMATLLEEIVSAFQHRVRHGGFTVRAELDRPLPSIPVDREAITQAVANLIDNAVKYSGESKKVCVRVSVEDQHLVVDVEDFGVGIEPGEMDRVFERFYRGGNELTRTVKGSGLGLTLVKQIVEAHRGSVHVDSAPGSGSTFSIRLPIPSAEGP